MPFAAGALVLLVLAGCSTRPLPEHARFDAPYTHPFTSVGTKYAALSPEVQNTILAQAGPAAMEDITVLNRPEGRVYRIDFANPGVDPPLHIAPDGSVLREDFEVAMGAPGEDFEAVVGRASKHRVSLAELPPEVVRQIRERAPGAALRSITSETWGERSMFVVEFEEENLNPKLYITSDGIVLKEDAK